MHGTPLKNARGKSWEKLKFPSQLKGCRVSQRYLFRESTVGEMEPHSRNVGQMVVT